MTGNSTAFSLYGNEPPDTKVPQLKQSNSCIWVENENEISKYPEAQTILPINSSESYLSFKMTFLAFLLSILMSSYLIFFLEKLINA